MFKIRDCEYKTAAFLYGGIGGATAGAMRSQMEYGGKVYRFKVLCSIDSDPVACRNHDLITGEKTSVCMDLFTRWQYKAWHGEEPPPEWKEVSLWDIWLAFQKQVPYFLFLSPPCKGFSGLLPTAKAKSEKYQALNFLTLHGLELALRACLEYGGSVPAVIQMENVPRMKTRGKSLLKDIKRLLQRYGYALSIRPDHNLGEIGGLGQNRVRFLIMARHEVQIPNVIYYPERKRLRSIGEVLSSLPMPGDTQRGGPLHKLPRLQWKTWMRLALIPAGGDWRDLNLVDWESLRVTHAPRAGAYAVEDWNETSRTVTGSSGPGQSNGATAVADPRLQISGNGKTNLFHVQPVDQPATCITGAAGTNQGAGNIADPTLPVREGRHPGVYQIIRSTDPAPCITGTRLGSGAIGVADPRVRTKLHPDCYGVQDWEEPSKTIRSASRIMQSPSSVSDPRVAHRPGRYTDQFRVQPSDQPAATVTGATDVQNGAPLIADPRITNSYHDGAYRVTDWEQVSPTITTGSVSAGQGKVIADPRIKSNPRANTMGVMEWHEPSKTIIGSGDIHAAAVAVADPRIPEDHERGVWPILSLDHTWHRPLTTYESAMIQSFATHLPDGRPFQLEGCSDAKAREYIGNAVPPDAQEEMGNVILLAAAEAEAGINFQLSWSKVWVSPMPLYPELPQYIQ